MSMMQPHIRALRAEADALERAERSWTGKDYHLSETLSIVVKAKRDAADFLEAEENTQMARLSGK